VRTHSQWRAAREHVLSVDSIRRYNKHHRSIIDGIKNRDVASTIDALNAHMAMAHDDLMGASAEE